jgi:hypothetical protein
VRKVITLRQSYRLVLTGLVGIACSAHAGEQRYEALAASVQAAMHGSVADRASPTLVFATPQQGQAWLSAMSQRLARHISDERTRLDLLVTVQYEARRAGARGYMQVMPFWIDLIGNAEHDLFKLRTNLRYGCVILRHYLDIERGDILPGTGALQRQPGQQEPVCREGGAGLAHALAVYWRGCGPCTSGTHGSPAI